MIIDSAGKEQKLKTWKFVQGTPPLRWLVAQPEAKPKEPVKEESAVPQALAFREENSTTFERGVLTLIPLDRLRSLDYDAEKELVTAKVATGAKPDEDAVLTGTIKYRGVNKVAIDAEVDKGDLGVAEVRYLGGVVRGGVRGLRFAAAKPGPALKGRPATVTIVDKGNKTEMPVTDLQPLYRVANGEKLSPLLFFKKTLKIDVAKIKKISQAESAGQDIVWQLTLKDGNEETLTLLKSVMLDGKPAELEGLLGQVPAGYKLFPVHVIDGVEFDTAKEKEKDKEPAKEKDKDK